MTPACQVHARSLNTTIKLFAFSSQYSVSLFLGSRTTGFPWVPGDLNMVSHALTIDTDIKQEMISKKWYRYVVT